MSNITTKQKEAAALAAIQRALEKYSEKQHVTYEDALVMFSCSNTYLELFDYDTLLWTQGPDYLMAIYEAEKAAKAFKSIKTSNQIRHQ